MGVASLIFGILGITVFCWLGPVLGGIWAGALMGTAALREQPEIITWPLWVLGLGVGVGFPALSVLLGIGSLIKSDKKGVAIAGLVAGVIAAIIGLVITFVSVAGLEAFDEHVMNDDQLNQQMQQLQNDLDDPLLQQKFRDRLNKAAQGVSDAPAQPEPMEPEPEQAEPKPMKPVPASPL